MTSLSFLSQRAICVTVVISYQLIERFNGRLPGYLGQGNDKFSFSHIDDVVEGHIAAMQKGRVGERYLLTGENASFVEVFDTAAAITGTKKPIFNIPLWLIETYGWVLVFISRITGKLPLISPPVRHQTLPVFIFCSENFSHLSYSTWTTIKYLKEMQNIVKKKREKIGLIFKNKEQNAYQIGITIFVPTI